MSLLPLRLARPFLRLNPHWNLAPGSRLIPRWTRLLMADSLLRHQGAAPFSWGAGQSLDAPGATRQRYIAALRAADAGDAAALLAFVRS